MTEHGSLAREGGQWNHIEMKRLEDKGKIESLVLFCIRYTLHFFVKRRRLLGMNFFTSRTFTFF